MLALVVAAALAEPVTLTAKNFDAKVFGKVGRGAFIKFQAPW